MVKRDNQRRYHETQRLIKKEKDSIKKAGAKLLEIDDSQEVPDPVISGYSTVYFCYRCQISFVGKKTMRPKYCPDCEKALAAMPKPYSALNGEFNERRE